MLLLKSRQKILAGILRNPGIHVNGLMKIIGSIKDIKTILNELEESKLIYSKYTGNLRQLFPLLNPLSISVFELVEEQEKKTALKKFSIIKNLINRIELFKKIFEKELISIVLFGSITRMHLTKKSDIDILFIVKKEKQEQKNKLLKLIQTITLNTGKEINPIIIEKNEFKKQLTQTTSFAKEIQKNRIIIHNTKEFLQLQEQIMNSINLT